VADVLVPEDGSVSSKFGSDLELDSVVEWLVSVSSSNLVDVPGLVLVVVAWVEKNEVVLFVPVTIDVETKFSIVADVFASSVVPSDLVV
jgi:hypothetical protein